MRRGLDALYRVAQVLSGAFLVLIAAIVLSQIVGRWLGFLVPSADEFAGFAMAATFFLALPFTLKSGGHIRVSFFADRFGPRVRRAFEAWAAGAGAATAGYGAWYATDMAWSSYLFGDLSFGMIPTPLWLPQSGFALGLIVLTVALIDELAGVVAGGRRLSSGEEPPVAAGASDG